ncbi:MAG: hypothetical protein LBH84_00945 [Prevotellaceae bacterium]|nr:hypothetical protein [Prevotellaceae bacterium]
MFSGKVTTILFSARSREETISSRERIKREEIVSPAARNGIFEILKLIYKTNKGTSPKSFQNKRVGIINKIKK